MARQSRLRGSSESDIEWDQPEAPDRRFQIPYTPIWEKKRGIDVFILRMNREVDRMLLQRGLFRLLRNLVYVVHLSVDVDLFGNTYGHIMVKAQSDVRKIIERYHRTSFFGKPLEFSETDPVVPVPLAFKRAVVALFVERNKTRMLLVELMRMFEEKYDQSISVMDILKMPDQVQRFVVGEAQMVGLAPNAQMWLTSLVRQGCFDYLETAKCSKGCSYVQGGMPGSRGSCKLQLCYRISLRDFSTKVRHLVKEHNGSMNLNSFVSCYEARFGTLVEDENDGSFLEHLLLSVSGVEIQHKAYESRKLVLRNDTEKVDEEKLSHGLLRFRWETLEMLMLQQRSCLPFGQFVQTYRMLYGKTIRVADFGCTRLVDLLGIFKEDIQVMGTGNNRTLTLSHAAQLYRFGKVLEEMKKKTRMYQTISAGTFAALYQNLYKHNFDPVDFGVCFLEDLMATSQTANISLAQQPARIDDRPGPQRPRVQIGEVTVKLMQAVTHNLCRNQKPGVYSLAQIEKPTWTRRVDDTVEVAPLVLNSPDSSCDSAYNHSVEELGIFDGKDKNEDACEPKAPEPVSAAKPRFVSARLAVSFY